jgi:hypothetical protein
VNLGVIQVTDFFLDKYSYLGKNGVIKKHTKGRLRSPMKKPKELLAVVPWALVFVQFCNPSGKPPKSTISSHNIFHTTTDWAKTQENNELVKRFHSFILTLTQHCELSRDKLNL